MGNQEINLFIVDDDKLTVTALKQYLLNRFKFGVNVSTFYDGESCLKKVDKKTDIVILDYFMEGKSGLDTLKAIKLINPKTEVFMLSSNEDMSLALQTFRAGANDYVIKGKGSRKKITSLVNHIVTKPLRYIVREFGVSKIVAIFIFTFALMASIVLFALYLGL
jgi:DNA-binding NarL/FixJ family response regulator